MNFCAWVTCVHDLNIWKIIKKKPLTICRNHTKCVKLKTVQKYVILNKLKHISVVVFLNIVVLKQSIEILKIYQRKFIIIVFDVNTR